MNPTARTICPGKRVRPRWRCRVGCALLLVGGWGGPLASGFSPGRAVAQASQETDLRRRVFAWVQQLQSEDDAVRAEAEKALQGAGLEALPLLINTDFGQLSDSAREALQRVRTRLLTERIRQAQEPTRVTLHGTMSLRAALDALGDQSHLRVEGGEGGDAPLAFQLEQVEFWRAFDTVLAAGNLRLDPYGTEPGVLRVVPADHRLTADQAPTVAYRGPFRIAVEQCVATRYLQHPPLDQLVVTLSVQWEPRLRLLALRQPLARIEVEVEQSDRSGIGADRVLPKHREQTVEAAVNSGPFRAELPLLLHLPPRSAGRLNRLSGTLEVLLAGPPESFEFANLELGQKDLRRERGAIALRLVEWRQESRGYLVDLELRVDNDDAVESYRNWPNECEVDLDQGMGVRIPPASQEILRQSAGMVAMRCLFTQDPSGGTLRFSAPLAVTTIEIPYEIHNIILP